jgi:hypothetical protein
MRNIRAGGRGFESRRSRPFLVEVRERITGGQVSLTRKDDWVCAGVR